MLYSGFPSAEHAQDAASAPPRFYCCCCCGCPFHPPRVRLTALTGN